MKILITYFGFAYIISWIVWFPLYGQELGLKVMPIIPFQHGIGGLGPLVASFLTTWIYYKNKGLKKLFKKCIQIKPILYLVIALLTPFLLALIATIMNSAINEAPINLSGLLTVKEFPNFNLLTFFIYNLIFFGFGEEVGWRGFALPRIQNKFNALTSSILLTIFWAFWHLPLFFNGPGYTSMEFTDVFGWFFSLLTGSILLSWLFNSSKGSILICAVFHSTIDIAFTADFADQNIVNYMGFLITVWGILTIIYFKPKNLAKIEREKKPAYNKV
ncbi:MAG: type II CAAX endopeptidase family protein [Eudoraea sp.]|uniref:CPBP family intramembrane glutamic endopeptidase n=1 Tax=Eudoraea sp. TaxID=1979955 RepID=UPI003C73F6CF